MFVKATRFFISAVHGNVDAGKVLEVSEDRGKTFINSGLAVAHVSPLGEFSPSFRFPVEADLPGSSSQAAQVSPKKTVNASEFGEKKVAGKRKEKSP